MTSEHTFSIVGANLKAAAWDGAKVTLANGETAAMPQTPNGSCILAWQNTDPQNSDGQLALTSGGSEPLLLDAPAGANQPSIMVHNWKANNLSLTNVSAADSTTIIVELFGRGIKGFKSVPFEKAPKKTTLAPMTFAEGKANPHNMILKMTSNSSDLAIIALIGGPQKNGNNAYVFALNDSGSGAPDGYTKVTSGNSISYMFNWGSSDIFVANMSPSTSSSVDLVLLDL